MRGLSIFKSFDNSEIYYESYGTGETIIMLHGNHMSGNFFKKIKKAYLPNYRVILLDSRAQGKSGNAQTTLEYEDMAKDIDYLLRHENIEKAHLLGYSDGANLALVFAKLFPKKAGILLLNAGNLTVKGVRWLPRMGIYFEMMMTYLLGLVTKNFHGHEVVKLMMKDTPVTVKELQQIESPGLVIVGTMDFINREESLTIASNLRNGAFCEIKYGTHFLAKTHVKTFNKMCLAFLNDWQLLLNQKN